LTQGIPPPDREAAEQMLVSHLPVLEAVVTHVARRHRLGTADRDDLLSMARVKLVENDYEVVRRFQGRSSFRSYLAVVVERVLLDDRAARWGRWRPSAIARRLGPLAVRLEAMLMRQRQPRHEAFAELKSRGFTESEDTLSALAAQLPVRSMRREVEEDAARDVPAPVGAEDVVLDSEASRMAARAEKAISRVLADLSARDRLVLEMHFLDGVRVADMARILALPPKPLYRRIERSLAALRRGLEEAGVTAGTVRELLDGGRLAPHLDITHIRQVDVTPAEES
jgi:RNA polymerase sigma factor (sigma-70 family)